MACCVACTRTSIRAAAIRFGNLQIRPTWGRSHLPATMPGLGALSAPSLSAFHHLLQNLPLRLCQPHDILLEHEPPLVPLNLTLKAKPTNPHSSTCQSTSLQRVRTASANLRLPCRRHPSNSSTNNWRSPTPYWRGGIRCLSRSRYPVVMDEWSPPSTVCSTRSHPAKAVENDLRQPDHKPAPATE